MNRCVVALLAAALLAPGTAAAQYPLFDSHIHYSRPDWDTYTPERILELNLGTGVPMLYWLAADSTVARKQELAEFSPA